MAFEPAKFHAKSCPNTAELRYAIRKSTSSASSSSVQISLSHELAKKSGISPDAGVRLEFDKKRNLGRIVSISSEVRAFRTKGGRRCLVAHWPWNGDVATYFPAPPADHLGFTMPLEVLETSSGEGLTFELPKRS